MRFSSVDRVIILVLLWLGAATAPAFAVDFENDIRPLMQRYCVSCHNAETTKGDLDLSRFESTAMVQDSLALWQRIAKRVESREMPPRKSRPLLSPQRKKLIEWAGTLQPNVSDCNNIASEESQSWYPGYVMSRRLNRAEYENTIRDLFGASIPVAHLFPEDGAGGEGFDNNGNALFLSAIQMEKYVAAAGLVVDKVFPLNEEDPIYRLAQAMGREDRLHDSQPGALKAARARILCEPLTQGLAPRAAAEVVVLQFMERAWRRPMTPDEVDRLLALFSNAMERGYSYEASIKLAVKAVLLSPHFLFLAEPQPSEPGVYRLRDYELAARLSYFLWGSMPDEELFRLAGQGFLNTPYELKRQVARMLQDPKAQGLGELFATQWLGITQLGETSRPDAERFPEFDTALAKDMRGEATMLFNSIVRGNRSILELLNADYTYVNERLAGLYGIEGVTGPELQRVQLDDARRGGVLGMAGVLTATSHPLRTSPVLRGKWVLEQLLGERVPPPPPGAGTLPEDDHQADGLSLRARMEVHRRNPDCAACHQSMDPIGFGLENFDPIGRWRNEAAGQPVDAEGVLPSGEKFNGPQELKAILMARKDAFARNLCRKLLGYAMGRSLTQYDECVIDRCMSALQAEDYGAAAIFREIALSHPFRHRYSARDAN